MDLEIDVPAVRACASGLAEIGGRTAGVSPEAPPGWATSDAATVAADHAHGQLTRVAAEIAMTAQQIIAAVMDYEAADERTADRLRALR